MNWTSLLTKTLSFLDSWLEVLSFSLGSLLRDGGVEAQDSVGDPVFPLGSLLRDGGVETQGSVPGTFRPSAIPLSLSFLQDLHSGSNLALLLPHLLKVELHPLQLGSLALLLLHHLGLHFLKLC